MQLDTLIKLLRAPHGGLRTHAELAAGFLLQRRGGERRRRVTLDPAALHGGDREVAGLHRGAGGLRLVAVVEVELVELLAVQVRQLGSERRVGRREEVRLDAPVFARLEHLDLGFPLANQAERDRLHAAGAAAAGQLAPQDGRQGEADEIVERTAGEIGLDQRLVEFARMVNGVGDRRLGDLVEGDALDVDALQRVLFFQHGADVPRDRLALAVRVGRQIKRAGAFDGLGDGGDLLGAALVGGPVHREILVRPHAAILGRQVAHMAETGENGEVVAKIFVDCLGLGRRFDDENVGHGIL